MQAGNNNGVSNFDGPNSDFPLLQDFSGLKNLFWILCWVFSWSVSGEFRGFAFEIWRKEEIDGSIPE